MTDSRNERNQYDYLRRLDVEELEKLLQLAVNPQSDEEDSDYVDALLEVILEKEKENDTGRLSDVDEKWQEFQRHYNTEEGKDQHMYYTEEIKPNQVQTNTSLKTVKTSRKKLKHILMAAALIALMVSIMTVPVFGQKTIFQLFSQWTSEQFFFGEENSLKELPEEYAELQAELNKQGITEIYVPKYIPEGFHVAGSDLYVSTKNGEVEFAVMYEKKSEYIIINVIQNSASLDIVLEKDNTAVERYNVDGIQYYLFENNERNVAVWRIEDIEYSIGTMLPVSEIKQMIDSI